MTEMVLYTKTLPEPLLHMIHAERVKVHEANGIVQLVPIVETKGKCPLRGIAADSSFSVDQFITMKQEEKRLEQ